MDWTPEAHAATKVAYATREAAQIQAQATLAAARLVSERDYGAGYRDGFAAGRAAVLAEQEATR